MHQEFLLELLRATELVERVAGSDITLEAFRREYDNFYYAAALDGHEGGVVEELLPTIGPVVALHRDVQLIVDSVYLPHPDTAPGYEAPGRIDAAEASHRLEGLASAHEPAQLVSDLRRRVTPGHEPPP